MANDLAAVRPGVLTLRRGRQGPDWTDWLSYAFLLLGVVVMLGPVVWVAISSFKSPGNLSEFPPTPLPYSFRSVTVTGYDKPLNLYDVKQADGTTKRLAQVRRVGIQAQMVDPTLPGELIKVSTKDATPVRDLSISWSNYTDLFEPSRNINVGKYAFNSIFITVVATAITLIINAMAAFALSKYRFPGRNAALVAILATLMVPATVLLVPVFIIVAEMGLVNNLWGVILPTVATPTGVFLLRQYMLTIPDELIEAARMDHASEWRIFWRIILPLSAPALAVVAIFSIIWRWNDFLLPLIVLSRENVFTLQLALNSFKGENIVHYEYLLSMTVMTALPVIFVFVFLQRFITSGIASTGIK
jgi:alpha-1,4-digalacturonate transport system permease protein